MSTKRLTRALDLTDDEDIEHVIRNLKMLHHDVKCEGWQEADEAQEIIEAAIHVVQNRDSSNSDIVSDVLVQAVAKVRPEVVKPLLRWLLKCPIPEFKRATSALALEIHDAQVLVEIGSDIGM